MSSPLTHDIAGVKGSRNTDQSEQLTRSISSVRQGGGLASSTVGGWRLSMKKREVAEAGARCEGCEAWEEGEGSRVTSVPPRYRRERSCTVHRMVYGASTAPTSLALGSVLQADSSSRNT